MQPNPNDPNKKDNKKKYKNIMSYQLGVVLHLNFGIHILLLTIINILVMGILIGLSSRFYPLVKLESLQTFIIVALLFTFIEVFIKGIMVRYLYRFILITFGIMFYLSNLLTFWLVDLSVPQISFLYEGTNIFTFTLLFMVIRLLFTTYVRKSKWIQGGKIHGL